MGLTWIQLVLVHILSSILMIDLVFCCAEPLHHREHSNFYMKKALATTPGDELEVSIPYLKKSEIIFNINRLVYPSVVVTEF